MLKKAKEKIFQSMMGCNNLAIEVKVKTKIVGNTTVNRSQ